MKLKKCILLLAALAMLLCTACGEKSSGGGISGAAEVAGDYYIDLTELGMKLTIYLRIGQDGAFQFSNTTSFEVNKSAGTVQDAGDGYLMVYSSVNGEEKSISEGITSKFLRNEDGSLDFTVCDRIYYGTAMAATTSAEHPDARLVAYPIPADYQAPEQDSDFTIGTYAADYTGPDGTDYTCRISFYEDSSYLLALSWQADGQLRLASETGRYGVSTTQLALTPQDGDRVSCDVVSDRELSVSMPVPGQEERTAVTFRISEASAQVLAVCAGDGAELTLYDDGSVSVQASGFTETGLLAADSEQGVFKFYPDHPSTGLRGINQVSTVPAGSLSYDGGLRLEEFRVRTSASLNREKCTLTQE